MPKGKNYNASATASEDGAPDLTAPYWDDKFASVTLQRGRPEAEGSGWRIWINDALGKPALTKNDIVV